MLERNQPDAIVSRASLGDMRGDELCAIVRSDPATREIAFVLLADLGAAPARHAATAGVDLLVGGEIPVPSVIVRIQRFLAERAGERLPPIAASPTPLAGGHGPARAPLVPAPLPVERPAAPAAPAAPVAPARPAAAPLSVQGSLAVMELADLLQALARARKTGRLHLALADGEGVLVLDTGRVVDARYGGRSAESAVAHMMAHAETGGSFAFYPLARGEVATEPRSIDASVERLLLEVAAQIDESRVAAERRVTAPPASVEKG
jgi:CheY-like chemotaxis protein